LIESKIPIIFIGLLGLFDSYNLNNIVLETFSKVQRTLRVQRILALIR